MEKLRNYLFIAAGIFIVGLAVPTTNPGRAAMAAAKSQDVFSEAIQPGGHFQNNATQRLVIEVVDIALHASQFGSVIIRDAPDTLTNQRQFVFPLTEIPQLLPDGFTEMGHYLTKIYVEPGQDIFVMGFSLPEEGFFRLSGYYEP